MGGTEHGYYELLGVAETATSAEIVSAYRRISRRVHPDVAGDSAAGLFRLIQHARDVLTDPARRAAYDSQRTLRSDPPRPQPD
ncbi:J domain-containing protein, partial [Pseudonocardia acidicola]